MKRRDMIVTILTAAFCSNKSEGLPTQVHYKGGQFTVGETDELVAFMIDIEQVKKQFKGKLYALEVRFNDRRVRFTPDELLDILEGVGNGEHRKQA